MQFLFYVAHFHFVMIGDKRALFFKGKKTVFAVQEEVPEHLASKLRGK
jgi:hypothetical protein